MPDAQRFFIVTGGPGSGKSTLIDALAAKGFAHMPEAGRAIIKDQVAIGGTSLPWSDRMAYAELMLSWEMRSHQAARALAGPVLFDRGAPDVLGYLKLIGAPALAHVQRAASNLRYNPRVFLAPPWPEIFTQDAERKQSVEEAEATCRVMIEVYSELGYELVHLPLASVAERVRFVRKTLSSGPARPS
ncbi:MAG: AAA family ATPase [Caulobacteraceae bacterium]